MTDVTFVEHRGARVTRTRWRTYLVLGRTLYDSGRIVARAARDSLELDDAERILKQWREFIFDVAKVTLVGRGTERLERGKSYVLLSNHVSLLDTPCVLGTFPGKLRFLSKIELRSVPVFGAAMEKLGIVFVDRKNLPRAIAQLEAAKPLLMRGISLWVAVEGTRSRDGRLQPFKKGGFHTALALGVPIVPVWIQGTLDVIPPDQWGAVTGQTVTVSYGEPIPTEGLGKDELPALMTKTREALLALARAAGARDDVDIEAALTPSA